MICLLLFNFYILEVRNFNCIRVDKIKFYKFRGVVSVGEDFGKEVVNLNFIRFIRGFFGC